MKELDKNIIIVGSSDIVLINKLGHKIDEYDVVVRFNRAPTLNYEEYVGSKTDVRFVNIHVGVNEFRKGDDMDFLKTVRDQLIICDRDINKKMFGSIYHESCDFQYTKRRDQYNIFKKNILSKLNLKLPPEGVGPSIGLGAICYYLNKGLKPTIYGFHLHDENNRVAPHYWHKKEKIGGCHNFTRERILIKKLAELNYLTILE